MNSIPELSSTLRQAMARREMRQATLLAAAGVSQRTLTNVLSGEADFKVSTLMALADRVGLELALVPKGTAGVIQAGETAPLRVTSRVQAARNRMAHGR